MKKNERKAREKTTMTTRRQLRRRRQQRRLGRRKGHWQQKKKQIADKLRSNLISRSRSLFVIRLISISLPAQRSFGIALSWFCSRRGTRRVELLMLILIVSHKKESIGLW
jgi:hypothetical protein